VPEELLVQPHHVEEEGERKEPFDWYDKQPLSEFH
jgi:hypothetical protein